MPLKISNPFHRATPAEKAVRGHRKEVKSQKDSMELMRVNEGMMLNARREVERQLDKAEVDIKKLNEKCKREARSGNRDAAKFAIIERNSLQQATTKLRQGVLYLSQMQTQAHLARVQQVTTNGLGNILSISDRMPGIVNPEKLREDLDRLQDTMRDRDHALTEAFDANAMEDCAEQEVEEELNLLMEGNQTTLAPYQPQRVSAVTTGPALEQEEEA